MMSPRPCRLVVVFATLLAAAPLAVAPPAGAIELTLAQAVDTALARNPALAAVVELRNQVAGGVREARADALPQVAAITSWGQSKNPSLLNSPDFEEILNQFPGGDFEPSKQELTRTGIEVTQPIWTFGKVGAAVELAKVVADTAEAQIETARLDTALAAAEAYFQVLSAREGRTTIEAELEFRRRDLDRIEDLLEIGEATELERLRAVAALAEVEPELVRRSGEVTVAEATFARVLALPPGEPLALAAVAAAPPAPPKPAALTELALGHRPELADLDLQQRVFEQRKKVTRAEGLPQIDFTGSWGREVRELGNLDDPLYSAWSFGVGLRWEFFDGGRRRGQIDQFESQRRQLELQRADLAARVRYEIDLAHSDFATARARSQAAQTSADAAREAVRVARESYEEGVANQTDLLDAQSRAVAARVLAVEAFYDAHVQAARLARATGRLPTVDWAQPPFHSAETSKP